MMKQDVTKLTRQNGETDTSASRHGSLLRGLSGKLLILTAVFVMIAEILIFVPSIANFRNVWLQNHLDTAEAASIVYLDSTDFMLSENARFNLLEATESSAVAIRSGGISRLMASDNMPGSVVAHINLDDVTALGSIRGALMMLFANDKDNYRVFGSMRSSNAVIELIQEMRHIKRAMWIYARNIMGISIIISVITAGLVFLALYWLIVRPIIRISTNMDAFSKAPENASLIYQPTGRRDELGLAEERLAAFQGDLQNTLRQKQHLADLGLAVSKINHDLRNILSAAQLFSDRLTSLPDPTVQRLAPKLIRTIDRAVEYTKSVITYGKAMEAPPVRRAMLLRNLVSDVAEHLALEGMADIAWENAVPDDFEVDADPEQLFRVLMNLCRNALQAMNDGDLQTMNDGDPQTMNDGDPQTMNDGDQVGRALILRVSAERAAGDVYVRVSDTGPGIEDHVREKLFHAFQGSTKPGGTGLGMTIAAELVRAHGGTISIENTSPAGTTILLVLPGPLPGNGGKID